MRNSTEDGILEFGIFKAGSQNINARFKATELMLLNGTDFSVTGDSTFTGNILSASDSTVDIGTTAPGLPTDILILYMVMVLI